jgi:hypothetical protein
MGKIWYTDSVSIRQCFWRVVDTAGTAKSPPLKEIAATLTYKGPQTALRKAADKKNFYIKKSPLGIAVL